LLADPGQVFRIITVEKNPSAVDHEDLRSSERPKKKEKGVADLLSFQCPKQRQGQGHFHAQSHFSPEKLV